VWELAQRVRWDRHNRTYDLVVVDAPASGHGIAMLTTPRTFGEVARVGPIRRQAEKVDEMLHDPSRTGYLAVALPEEMPVNETIELVARVREELTVPLGAVIVNRVLPELFTRDDEAVFDALRSPAASSVLERAVGPGSVALLDAARLAVSLRRTRSAHLAELRAAIDLPLLYLPYLFVRDHGLRVTRMVADRLGEELGL
jgi:anion-transporting  ArsA/GET3 family ATPase